MKCPHCTKQIHVDWSHSDFGSDREHFYRVDQATCPACYRTILRLRMQDRATGDAGRPINMAVRGSDRYIYIHPRVPNRAPIHKAVPTEIAQDYKEACLVLADSPKASAALSRRCLQHLLRDKGGVKHGNLSREIEEAMGILPSHLSGAIDGVRNIGNFAAHPIKSESTGAPLVGPHHDSLSF